MAERRAPEPRRGGDARAERNFDAARRRMDGLEKALSLIEGAMIPGTHLVDQTKTADFRQGIEIARALLSLRSGRAGQAQPEQRPREEKPEAKSQDRA